MVCGGRELRVVGVEEVFDGRLLGENEICVERLALIAFAGWLGFGDGSIGVLGQGQREHHVGLVLDALVLAFGADDGRLELDLEQVLDERAARMSC